MKNIEIRDVYLFAGSSTAADLELRFTEGTPEQPHRFVGVIPYNSLSADLGGFKEKLMPTAFRSTLASGSDIQALASHDPDKLLGRTSNSTLRVAHTDKGLAVEVDLPDTSYARDMRELVKRGDVNGLSFGFNVKKDGQRFVKEGGQTIRELHDVNLREVSIVSRPAYPETSLSIRSLNIDPAVLAEIRAVGSSPACAARRMQLLRAMAA